MFSSVGRMRNRLLRVRSRVPRTGTALPMFRVAGRMFRVAGRARRNFAAVRGAPEPKPESFFTKVQAVVLPPGKRGEEVKGMIVTFAKRATVVIAMAWGSMQYFEWSSLQEKQHPVVRIAMAQLNDLLKDDPGVVHPLTVKDHMPNSHFKVFNGPTNFDGSFTLLVDEAQTRQLFASLSAAKKSAKEEWRPADVQALTIMDPEAKRIYNRDPETGKLESTPMPDSTLALYNNESLHGVKSQEAQREKEEREKEERGGMEMKSFSRFLNSFKREYDAAPKWQKVVLGGLTVVLVVFGTLTMVMRHKTRFFTTFRKAVEKSPLAVEALGGGIKFGKVDYKVMVSNNFDVRVTGEDRAGTLTVNTYRDPDNKKKLWISRAMLRCADSKSKRAKLINLDDLELPSRYALLAGMKNTKNTKTKKPTTKKKKPAAKSQ